MKIAVTGAAGFLGRALISELAARHEVSAADLKAEEGDPAIVRGDVLELADMEELCRGVDAVVHLACGGWDEPLTEAENEACLLDTRLKGTYNVLQAAVEAGVKRVVQVSDLCVFSGYEEELMVSEDFLPLPDTSAYQQSVYLSEWVGREFSREHSGLVLTLRLGKLVDVDALAPDAVFEEDWLAVSDAVAAIGRALEVEEYDGLVGWGLYHLAADVPQTRYSLLKIQSGTFAFSPAEDFGAWRQEV